MKSHITAFFIFIATISNGQIMEYNGSQTNCSEEYLKKELDNKKELFSVVENPPHFGVCSELIATKKNSYECSDNNIRIYLIEQGLIKAQTNFDETLIIQFIIEKNGCVNQIKVLTNTSAFSNIEIVNMFKRMTDWQPGEQNNKVVRVLRIIDVKSIANKPLDSHH